jgi:hypothetical protein
MYWYNKKLLFGLFFSLACFVAIIIVLNTGEKGWGAFDFYEQSIDSQGHIVLGKHIFTIYSGVQKYIITSPLIDKTWSGTLPDEGVLGIVGKAYYSAGNYVIGFGSSGLACIFIAAGIFAIGWYKQSAYIQFISVLGMFVAAGLLISGCVLYARKAGLDYGYVVYTFAAFGTAIAASFGLYGLAEETAKHDANTLNNNIPRAIGVIGNYNSSNAANNAAANATKDFELEGAVEIGPNSASTEHPPVYSANYSTIPNNTTIHHHDANPFED